MRTSRSSNGVLVVVVAMGLALSAGCMTVGPVIPVEPGPDWTVERALSTVVEVERSQLAGTYGELRPEHVTADEESFTDVYLTGVSSTTQGTTTTTTSSFGIRRIRYRDIHEVRLRFAPLAGTFLCLFTAGIIGPWVFDTRVVLDGDLVGFAEGRDASGRFESNLGCTQPGEVGWNLIPLWLVGARFWVTTKHEEYFTALEFLRRRAAASDTRNE